MAVTTAQGTAIMVPCPACGMPVQLHLGAASAHPDGYLVYDSGWPSWGMNLHLRVGCEAT